MRHTFDPRKLEAYLKDKWQDRSCPMCHSTSWSISDTIYELRKFTDSSLIMTGGPVMPVIPIGCDACGNTVFINAYTTGILPSS